MEKLIGGEVLYFKKISSTQTLAKKLARDGWLEGTVVLAERQTAGRGRLNRQWVSPPGGLWFSIILRPKISPSRVTQLVIPASLSVVKAIKRTVAVDTRIKWPNDIVIEKSEIRNLKSEIRNSKSEIKKLGGILIDSEIAGKKLNWVALGVGVNVNNRLPRVLQPVATNLLQNRKTKRKISCKKIFQSILTEFQEYYALFLQQGLSPILTEYKKFLTTNSHFLTAD